MTPLATYWVLWIGAPIVLAVWTFTVHLDANDKDEATGFLWRRDFAPVAILFAALFGLFFLL